MCIDTIFYLNFTKEEEVKANGVMERLLLDGHKIVEDSGFKEDGKRIITFHGYGVA